MRDTDTDTEQRDTILNNNAVGPKIAEDRSGEPT